MDYQKFKSLVDSVSIGKKLPEAIYIHKDTFQSIDEQLIHFINAISKALKVDNKNWNIVKLSKKDFKLSLLNYPSFFTDSYPPLEQSITIDLVKLTQRITKYSDYDNPPILHRKETMLSDNHPSYEEFKLVTQEGEAAGLYQNSRMIGFKSSWERLIAKHGYELVDGRLFRNSALIKPNDDNKKIDRHKTAIVRHELSSPMKSLAKHGFLSGEHSVFDYGCGQGDDLRELEAHGIDAIGWDPNFRPDTEKVVLEIVNIGFVINVIEEVDERIEALLGAWEITAKLLVVSAMIANDSHIEKFTPYKDGVLTSRNTFQKYFSQTELQFFIENTLDENAISVGTGIFFIFKDTIDEQLFLSSRNKRHHNWQQITTQPLNNQEKFTQIYLENEQIFKDFWDTCLTLGRIPANDEFSQSDEIKLLIGSHKKAFNYLNNFLSTNEFELAQHYRKDDLLVYFALSQFEKRKHYTRLPIRLQRDVKSFFGNYLNALESARELLFSVSNTELITEMCLTAHKELPASVLNEEHSLVLHKDFIELLPTLLRVYIGSASQLFGDQDDIQLIKIHFNSGKVSFMGYENFDESPLPILKERIKVKMGQQEVDFFDYIEGFGKQPLYFKSKYITEDHQNYKKQIRFDEKLALYLPHSSGYGPNLDGLKELLIKNKLEIKGFRFYNDGTSK